MHGEAWNHTSEMTRLDESAPRIEPSYPGFEALYGVTGTVKVSVDVDANGKVIKSALWVSSGSPALNEAATRAIAQWKFRPATFDGKPTTGVAFIPVIFAPGHPERPWSWPKGFEHPRYNLVALDSRFTSIDTLIADVVKRSKGASPVSSGVASYNVRSEQGELIERWTFTDLHTPRAMAIRFVFSNVDGQPTVTVAALCDDQATCESRTPLLLQGPTYAKTDAPPTT